MNFCCVVIKKNMYFASANSKKGKSYYAVKEYCDVIDENGNVKRKTGVQTKVSFEGQVVDVQSSQNNDSSEDEDDHVYHDLDIPVVEQSISTDHQKRKESNARHWQELRSKLVEISLATEGFPSYGVTCRRCSNDTAIYRCIDCGGAALSMCKACCDQVHENENIFHFQEVWQDQEWKPYLLPKELVNPFHDCANGKEKRMITVVDSKGRHHDVSITFCQCETPGETLAHLHLWPATPCNPSLAFTWDLLTSLQSLMFECQVSVYDYVKHLDFYKTIFDRVLQPACITRCSTGQESYHLQTAFRKFRRV
ncbi:uncharacterized protein LOC116288263 [Actinia tenebrosa]|uniref:Uncharacterized protein LOC116288263 n=1 Tax=Actinia tenebrosa TaxID=6105 RepID=A0A6P8H3F9_ACTTE|nr:uncharacterized protein LOC116288263 [Actinia tenebrosa]